MDWKRSSTDLAIILRTRLATSDGMEESILLRRLASTWKCCLARLRKVSALKGSSPESSW